MQKRIFLFWMSSVVVVIGQGIVARELLQARALVRASMFNSESRQVATRSSSPMIQLLDMMHPGPLFPQIQANADKVVHQYVPRCEPRVSCNLTIGR